MVLKNEDLRFNQQKRPYFRIHVIWRIEEALSREVCSLWKPASIEGTRRLSFWAGEWLWMGGALSALPGWVGKRGRYYRLAEPHPSRRTGPLVEGPSSASSALFLIAHTLW